MRDKILVTRPFFPEREAFDRYVDEIWENKWLTNQGPLHQKFEQALKDYLGVEHMVLTVNGHVALEVALRGLNIHGEVITTPFTFASTVHSIALCGMQPVFCDVRESDLTMNPDLIESVITDKTEAILPVHVYGHPCDTDRIERIAQAHNLKVLYDAAHTFGARKNGHCLALKGDASIYSFHATKLFNSIEGGAIVFKDGSMATKFNQYKNFGIESEDSIPNIGGNGKMNEFQAAMGLANLPYLPEIIAQRKEYTLRYRARLADIRGMRLFRPENEEVEYNYAYFPVYITDEAGLTRDQLYEALHEDGIYTRKYFYPLLSDCACYCDLPSAKNLPVARKASASVMTLPLYNNMGLDTVDYICDCIEKHMMARM